MRDGRIGAPLRIDSYPGVLKVVKLFKFRCHSTQFCKTKILILVTLRSDAYSSSNYAFAFLYLITGVM